MSSNPVTNPVSEHQQSSSQKGSAQNAQSWKGRIINYENQEKARLLAPIRSQLEERVKDGIETPLFFRHVFSLENGQGMRVEDPLKINLDFLKSRRNELAGSQPNDPQLIRELDEMIPELEQALELQLVKLAERSKKKPALVFRTLGKPAESLLKKEAAHIVQAVKNGESRLLACALAHKKTNGHHAVGIRFSQGEDPDTVICSIFNSGAGIEKWHKWSGYSEKYDPEYTVRIPKSELTSDLVHPLLLDTVEMDEIYEKFSNIQGAKVLDAKEKEAEGRLVRHQQAQKGGNCSSEWFWAYVKCQIKGGNRDQNYKNIRTPFMEKTFEAAIKNFDKPAPFLGPYATALKGGEDLDVLRRRMIKKMGKVEADKYPNKTYSNSEFYWEEFPEVEVKIDQEIRNLVEGNALFKHMISQGHTKQEAWKELFGNSRFYKRMYKS